MENNIFHAVVFVVKKGACVKTTTTNYLKQIVCCQTNGSLPFCDQCIYCQKINNNTYTDLVQLDATSADFSKSKIIELQNKFSLTGVENCQKKLCLINHFDLCNIQVYNSMLQFIEDDKPNTYFIFIVRNAHVLPKTILSRCQLEVILAREADWKNLQVQGKLTDSEIEMLKLVCWTIDEATDYVQNGGFKALTRLVQQIFESSDLEKFASALETFKKLDYVEIRRVLVYLMNQSKYEVQYTKFLELIAQLKFQPNRISVFDQILRNLDHEQYC